MSEDKGYTVPDSTLFDSDAAEWEYMKEKEKRSAEWDTKADLWMISKNMDIIQSTFSEISTFYGIIRKPQENSHFMFW